MSKTCPECGREKIQTFWATLCLPRGKRACLPVKACGDCGFEYLDHVAQDMLDATIKAADAAGDEYE